MKNEKEIASWFRENSNGAYEYLLKTFPHATATYVQGGSVLACLLDQKLNDLDVMFDGVADEELSVLDASHNKNHVFGDRTVYNYNGLDMDIWTLGGSKEATIMKNICNEFGVNDFLALLPFNLDKIAFDAKTETIIDAGCLEGIRDRKIVYDTKLEDGFYTHAARAYLLQQKTGFDFAPSTLELLEKARRGLSEDSTRWELAENQLRSKHSDLIEYVRGELVR